LDKAVLRLMDIVGAEADFAGEAARRWLGQTGRADLPVGRDARQHVPTKIDFWKLPIAIQRRVLQSQLANAGVAPDFELIESLRQSADCFVSVGPNISVVRNVDGTVALRTTQISEFNAGEQAVKLGKRGHAKFDGRHFRWHVQTQKPTGGTPVPLKQREVFDADKIGGGMVLRHWRAGDRFQPIGMKSAAKLQDLFVNAKISTAHRRELVLATTKGGEIFWVEGLRIGERFKLTPQTRRKLVWKWSNLAV
jgi:tRNA(Ile)-lysidine synthase